MPLSMDLALRIDLVMGGGDYFRREGQNLGPWEYEAIEINLHPSLADKVSGRFVVLEVARDVGSTRKDGMAKAGSGAQIAEERVAYLGGFGREVGFIECAMQKRSCG